MPRKRRDDIDITQLHPLVPGKRNRRGEGGGKPKKWTSEAVRKLADDFYDWFTEDLIPNENGQVKVTRFFFKEYAVKAGVPFDYFSKFAKVDPYFAEVYAKIHDVQEIKLVRYGMAGVEPGFVRYMLEKHHGYGYAGSSKSDPALPEDARKQTFVVNGKKIEF